MAIYLFSVKTFFFVVPPLIKREGLGFFIIGVPLLHLIPPEADKPTTLQVSNCRFLGLNKLRHKLLHYPALTDVSVCSGVSLCFVKIYNMYMSPNSQLAWDPRYIGSGWTQQKTSFSNNPFVVACVFVAEGTLLGNERLPSLHYSGFQASCHNIFIQICT
jgi:hypothetical protein